MDDFKTVDFLYELSELRGIKRRYMNGLNDISVAEHSFRVAYIALALAKEMNADVKKVLELALMHDISEVRTGDANPWQKPYVKMDEQQALKDMLEGTAVEYLSEYGEEYEERASLEAQIVKDADMIDVQLELREMASKGNQCLEFFENMGALGDIESAMRTDAGKKLIKLVKQRSPFDRALTAQSSILNKTHGK